ncbi:HAAS signaling domain-containing protein [Jeotgalibacillus proteolyticus]|uniref:HAAS signaling domain-containing protein n=1 Tax=Jeotgalibacillus proteolyticus TaxID=2082395 RepID=UPI003CF2243C
MDRLKIDYLNDLDNELRHHPNRESILEEYEVHLEELITELQFTKDSIEEVSKRDVTERLGTPQEIAHLWLQEKSVTPGKMKWLFTSCNIFIFLGGGLLTFFYNVYEWAWIQNIWILLTSIPVLISIIYLFFWALLGYEIGKGFGYKGHSLLRKTFIFSLVPNITLMVLVVFRIVPQHWFAPLLSHEFILSCIAITIVLYPISLLSYKWGRRASV